MSGSGFYVVLEGEAIVKVGDDELNRLRQGEFFGEISTLLGDPHGRRDAGTPLRVLEIPGPKLEAFLLNYPRVMLRSSRRRRAAAGSARLAILDRPSPPGEYPVVVVGSGPGGLQTSYSSLARGRPACRPLPGRGAGRHVPKVADLPAPASWTKPDAPVERGTREYEWYDHNSLVADDPECRALVAAEMDRAFIVPRALRCHADWPRSPRGEALPSAATAAGSRRRRREWVHADDL